VRARCAELGLNDPDGDPAWDANVLRRDSGDSHIHGTLVYAKRVIYHYEATEHGKMVAVEHSFKLKCDLLKLKEHVDYAIERIEQLEELPREWLEAVPNPHLPGIEEEDDDEEHEVEVDIDEEDDDERDQVYPADEPATPVRASFREDREFPSREF